MNRNNIMRLKEIREEMLGLLSEADDLISETNNQTIYNRAKSYWLPHIEGALDKENSQYLGGSMVDMSATINELMEEEEEEEEED